MKGCVDNLGKANYISKLDLLKGDWQVQAVALKFLHLLEYSVMAFGTVCVMPRPPSKTEFNFLSLLKGPKDTKI